MTAALDVSCISSEIAAQVDTRSVGVIRTTVDNVSTETELFLQQSLFIRRPA